MLRVGLTGGIGSGKSMVAARLAHCGALIIDSDRIAREVTEPGAAGLRAVAEEFGPEIIAEDGTLNRAALAKRVFHDAGARDRLNAIVHPLVAACSAELVALSPPNAVVVQDVPLLIEAGLAATFPLVIVVYADAHTRLHRLIERRGMAPTDAAARIVAQATDEQRRGAADVWIDNNGRRPDTLAAVDQLWAERLVPFEDNLRHRRRALRAASPVLVAPDERWPQQAQRMIARIGEVAAGRAWRIDHIGSTSVPGLDAKDVVDVQVVVADLEVAQRLAADLSTVGLVTLSGRWWDNARDGTTWDKAFVTNADPTRDINCHIRPASSPAWRQAVLLRDWLRAHPDDAREYAELKHRLVARPWDSIDAYASAKTPFLRGALDRAERWALRCGWVPT